MLRARVVIADDHAGFREQTATLIAPEFDVVSTVGDGQAAVEASSALDPDIVILDISMPVVGGIAAAKRLQEMHSRAKVVFLSVHEDPQVIDAALAVGAAGYVVKSRVAGDLPDALRMVLAGEQFVPKSK